MFEELERQRKAKLMDPVSINQLRSATTLEALRIRWDRLAATKKSGLVNIITTLGTMTFKLFYSTAPAACDNFTTLCEHKFYDNVSFHRLIKGFMVQGGDPTGTGRGSGKTAWTGVSKFPDEFHVSNTHASRGTLSMANSGPDTNGTQFFITFNKTSHLDFKHTVFGTMLAGNGVLDSIEKIPVNDKDVPTIKINILSTKVIEKPLLNDDSSSQGNGAGSFVVVGKELLGTKASLRPKVTSSTAVGSFMRQMNNDTSKRVNNEKRKRVVQNNGPKKNKKKKKMAFDGW